MKKNFINNSHLESAVFEEGHDGPFLPNGGIILVQRTIGGGSVKSELE
jgi:hypothetical protein